jgi:hypothetical protein
LRIPGPGLKVREHIEVTDMEEHCNSSCRGHDTKERPQGKTRAPSQSVTVEPPPKETGPEPLYRVVYMIDISAKGPRQAAELTYRLIQDPDSMPPVLDVLDHRGQRTRVDLSDE